MVDPDTLKAIAGIVSVAFPLLVKGVSRRLEKKRQADRKRRLNDVQSRWEEIRKRLTEFDEVIHISTELETSLPEELIEIIEERNYYKLMSDHYRRVIADKMGVSEDHGSIQDLIKTVDGSSLISNLRDRRVYSSQLGLVPVDDSGQLENDVVGRTSPVESSSDRAGSASNDSSPITQPTEVGITGPGSLGNSTRPDQQKLTGSNSDG